MVTKSGKDLFRSFSALWCSEICKIILFHNTEHRVSPAFSLLHLIIREFGIRKGLKKLVISSKIRIFIGENQ